MGNNRDDLTPKQIIDKNGKSTTVYTKLRDFMKPKRKESLQLSPQLNILKNDHETFSNVVSKTYTRDDTKRITKIINKHDPSIIAHFDELFAMSEVDEHYGKNSSEMTAADSSNRPISTQTYLSEILVDCCRLIRLHNEGNLEYLKNVYLPSLKDQSSAAWHTASVSIEIDPNTWFYQATEVNRQSLALHEELAPQNISEFMDETTYWRGLTFLALIDLPTDDTAPEFIEWIAEHPDPERIVNLARERNTTNAPLLKELAGDSGTLNVLTDGLI